MPPATGSSPFPHDQKLQINYKEVSDKYQESRNYVVHDVIFDGKALDITFAEFRYIEINEEKPASCA